MFKDVEFIAPSTVVMTKKLWAENELILAGCLMLPYDPASNTVTADLYTTTRRALYDFLNVSFTNFMHNPDNKHFRDMFFDKIKAAYAAIQQEIYDKYISKEELHEKFYQHQNDGLVKIIPQKYNLLSFEQQLGKSITAVTKSKVLGIRRTVIICPGSLKWKWMTELTRNWGYNQLYFTILDAANSRSITALNEKFIIINYEMVGRFMKYMTRYPIGHLILDECTRVKSANSARFKNVKALIESNPDMHVTLLSGTPVQNRVNDVFAYFKLIGNPLADNYAQFMRDYTNVISVRGGGTKITGAKNVEELRIKMGNFMIRRRRKDCMDLPPETIGIVRFRLEDYKEEYDAIVKEMIENRVVKNLNSCIQSLNIVTAKAKIPGIIDIIETTIEEGRKIVVFCSNTDPLHQLADHFKEKAILIDGGVALNKRSLLVDKFISTEECAVFLGNTQSAGEGWSLQVASDVLFVNFPMTHAALNQAKDRVQGIGQTSPVSVTYTVCDDSVDEHLLNLIASKDGDSNALIDGGKDAVDYGNINEQVFNKLIESYQKDHPEYHGKTEVEPTEGISS